MYRRSSPVEKAIAFGALLMLVSGAGIWFLDSRQSPHPTLRAAIIICLLVGLLLVHGFIYQNWWDRNIAVQRFDKNPNRLVIIGSAAAILWLAIFPLSQNPSCLSKAALQNSRK
jgi:hypothetical protein